jgi:hydroxymethylbilane synthase
LDDLARGARVGTGSLRRAAQVLVNRPDAQILPIRGNIDTRIRKLREGQFDATLLAMAGVRRASLFDSSIMRPLEMNVMLPAPGQGALALQCRRDDVATRALLEVLNDAATAACVLAEREIVLALHGDCHSPIGANATMDGSILFLRAAIGQRDGKPPIIKSMARGDAKMVVEDVIDQLVQQGAQEALKTGR